jgi:hypothetical protein
MRRVFLVILIVLAIFGFGAALLMTSGDSSDDDSALQNTETTVELSGTSNATQLDPSDNAAAQDAIKDMVIVNEPNNTTSYVAVVRKDSISNSTTSYGAPKLRYIVDLPELQRTFVVEREGDASSDFASLYVLCPGVNELRYPAKSCRQVE